MNIIDGKAISKQIKDEVKEKVAALKAQGVTVTLAVVQVGNDPASSVYVNNKKKACAYTGMESESFASGRDNTGRTAFSDRRAEWQEGDQRDSGAASAAKAYR